MQKLETKTQVHNQNEQILADQRDTAAHQLLGLDYEYAVENGLIDMFYLDAKTGDDGFRHVLGGVETYDSNEGVIPMGFHHEPSSSNPSQTFVDRDHLAGANSQKRKEYREYRFEPYLAQTVIGNYEKKSKSTMFPKEYDALATLFAIKQARDSFEQINEKDGFMVGIGHATMLDGRSQMDIRMVLESASGKVVTAYPRTVKNRMSLGKHAVHGIEEGSKDKDKMDEFLGLK